MNIGDTVKILDKNIYGTIEKINKNNVVIISNNKQVTTTLENIEPSKFSSKKTKCKYYYERNNINYEIVSSPSNELMIRHQTVLEAMQNVEKFLDTAVFYKLPFVKIIHGKHGGILKKELHQLLNTLYCVDSYCLGNYYNGQDGVTIVYLK